MGAAETDGVIDGTEVMDGDADGGVSDGSNDGTRVGMVLGISEGATVLVGVDVVGAIVGNPVGRADGIGEVVVGETVLPSATGTNVGGVVFPPVVVVCSQEEDALFPPRIEGFWECVMTLPMMTPRIMSTNTMGIAQRIHFLSRRGQCDGCFLGLLLL